MGKRRKKSSLICSWKKKKKKTKKKKRCGSDEKGTCLGQEELCLAVGSWQLAAGNGARKQEGMVDGAVTARSSEGGQ